MGCFSGAWFALMRRNMIYLRRNWTSTLLELALPLAFVYILVAIKTASESGSSFDAEIVNATFPDVALTPLSFTDYVTAMRAKRICLSDGEDGFSISGISDKGLNWQVPLVKCDSRLCTASQQDASTFCEYGMVAVAGNDNGGKVRAEAFKGWVETKYPAIVTEGVMPFDFDLVQVFDSSQAMNDYVKLRDYGKIDKPKIVMGIVWEGDSGSNFTYELRPNSTNFNTPENEERPGTRTTPSTDKVADNFARDDQSVCGVLQGTASQGPYEQSCTGQYLYNGVLTFQRLVHDFILDQSGAAAVGTKVAEAGVQFAPFPTKSYESSGFYDTIEGLGAFLIVLGLLYPASSMISYIVKEKELRQKELMKMMSVSESDINWSWFATFFIVHFFTASFATLFSTSLYEKSDGMLLWIFWMLTMIAIICFCMTVSALTSQTIRAILIGLLLFFAGYMFSDVFWYDERDTGLLQILSLHPVTAFAYGLNRIGSLEGDGVGLTWDSIDFRVEQNGYAFRNTLNMLFVDCIVWGVLAWYFNRIVTPDFGQALPWYFPFTPTFWFPGSTRFPVSESTVESTASSSGIPLEPVSDALKRQTDQGQSIEIVNLRKQFGEKTAVDGLNLSIYSGQITALLGHNGAGKTTTISMLTGAVAPTDGYVNLAGKDVRTDLKAIRQDIGICLQHDCLFPNLTVREHVQFFSRLKGLYKTTSKEEAEEQIDQAIRDVALFEKRNTFSKDLSGGMKRKLSVSIAFCGGSKVVVLDEPTSGMDPFSRRFTWNVIRNYKKDRIIILTTHFMDEADILGDRIAIMAEGQLRCAGSSLFLKRHYGVGYQLTVEKSVQGAEKQGSFVEVTDDESETPGEKLEPEPPSVSANLKRLIKASVPHATLLNDVGTEVRYQLPLGASDQFAEMFEHLDAEVDQGSITSYGVSMTTLDEVFLLVARGDSANEEKSRLTSSRRLDVDSITEGEKSARSQMDLNNEALFGRHVSALLRKRAFNFQRDKKAWCCTTILPVIFVTIGFLVMKLASPERNLSPVTLDLSDFNPDVSVSPVNPIPVNSPINPFVCQPGVCSYTPLIEVNETQETYTFCGSHALLRADGNASIAMCTLFNAVGILRTVDGYQDAISMETNVGSILETSNSLFDSASQFEASQYGAIWFTREPGSMLIGNASSNVSISDAIDVACQQAVVEGLDYVTERDCANLREGYGYVIQYNHTGLHSAPLYQTLADQSLVRNALQNPDITITTTIAPLPLTEIEEGIGNAADTFSVWFLVMLSFPFIAGSYAAFVVVERESKAKHLQTVAGVEPTAYWISTLLWDTINYQIPVWLVVAELFLFDASSLTTSDRDVFSGVLAILFFYGPASAGFAYCWSFAFKSPSLCNVFLIVVGFLIGFAGPLTIFILTIIGSDRGNPRENLINIASGLTWILRFTPSFCLGKGLFYAINIESIAFFEEDQNISAWSEPVLLVELVFLILQGVGYTFLAILLDIWSSNPQMMKSFNNAMRILTCRCCGSSQQSIDITTAQREDEDVKAEEERVLSGGANDDHIVVNQMSKLYSNGKLAVNNLTLGIPHGECFGLLGINGAGKTTTMGMLTAEFPPSSGDATLAGYSISREPQKTRRRIGYCPQFDAHFAQLSGRNHVELYASIKGIPPEFVKEAAALKLQEVGLSDFDSDRLCSNYSGGMKRRLSLACATIGQPQIVFLDECSTGVDPVARREIWQLVSDMVSAPNVPKHERASVILTTHSMEECEALCPRIGIMANGRLRCLGSAQHLKNKFGQGFQVELKTMIADREDDDYIRNSSVLAAVVCGNSDVEAASVVSADVTFNQDQTILALQELTKDNYLSDMVSVDDPVGYGIWKDCTSANGVSLDVLAAFATVEVRMRSIATFMTETFPQHVLRERQDTKARYEVSASATRISSIFEKIEAKKNELRLADYGVSQTSLEQVFNMHAAEAEKLKQGRDDH